MRSGYLSASFDLLNVGDLDLITQAKDRCDRLVVGVYTDDYVEQISGRPPVVPLVERLELIRHVRGVDHAIIHNHRADQEALGREYVVFRVGDVDEDLGDGNHIFPLRQTASSDLLTALAPAVDSAVKRGVA